MANNNNNTVDKKLPVQFILPDGDIAAVCTWEFIMDRMRENLQPTIVQLRSINDHLDQIDRRLGELIAE